MVVRYRGTGARRPLLLLAHLDVVEAKREDWSFDPFTLTEKEETLARAQVTECPLCDLHPRLSTLRDPNIP